MDPIFLLIIFGIPMIGNYVSKQMRQRFVQYSEEPIPYSGQQIAEMMLESRGIQNVEVTATPGQLTDHYDPVKNIVNLSQSVFSEYNLAAASVAAHECGHAVQDATNYPLLMARTKMVPLLRMSNFAVPVLAFGGAGISEMTGRHGMAVLCAFALGLPALFSLITLPVEFDASRRALDWMEEAGLAVDETHAKAKKALFWAAMTYVVAALGAIVQAFYWARLFMRRTRR